MPLRSKFTPEFVQQILDLYADLRSLRETARRLEISEITVRNYVRATKALCERCTAAIPFGQRFCDTCNEKRTARARERRKERRRAGLCVECDARIQPPSTQFCDTHRLAHQEKDRQYKTRQKRDVNGHGVPTVREREKQIRYNYGQAGIEAWHRDQGSCVLCGVHYEEKTIHIHHIDTDPTNNVAGNLACLCLKCHRLVHSLIEHSAPNRVIDWIVANYPTRLIAQLIQRGQPRKRRPRSRESTAMLSFDFVAS